MTIGRENYLKKYNSHPLRHIEVFERHRFILGQKHGIALKKRNVRSVEDVVFASKICRGTSANSCTDDRRLTAERLSFLHRLSRGCAE